ncbi:MAG: DUF4401 domain-containing protein [Chloroflexi bacterium]|nr:DUF4401 domain-containing protein [Chloroflexota bacterium]
MTSFTPSLQTVVDQLVAKGHLAPDEQSKMATTLSAAPQTKTPWYVRGLIGISAWFAAIPLLAFLFFMDLISSEADAVFVGMLFCAGAIVLKRVFARSIFVGQLTLAFSLAGQVLFIGGIIFEVKSMATIVMVTIVLESVLIWLYPDQLHRFLSTIIIIVAICVLLVDLEVLETIHFVILTLAAVAVLIWDNESYLSTTGAADAYSPVGYGLLAAMFVLLCLATVDELEIFWWWISAGGLLLLLLYLEYRTLSYYGLDLQPGTVLWVMGGTIVAVIPSMHTPGILAAIIVLLLGFRRGNRVLMGTAAAFLVLFLGAYYYSLEMTLLVKSFALMGTGLAILTTRHFLLRYLKQFRNEVTL